MVTRGGPIGCTRGASRRRGRLRLAARVVRRRGPYLPDGRWSRRADQRRVRIHTGCPRRGQPVWMVEGQVRLAPARWWTSGVDRVAVRRIHSRQPGGARTRTADRRATVGPAIGTRDRRQGVWLARRTAIRFRVRLCGLSAPVDGANSDPGFLRAFAWRRRDPSTACAHSSRGSPDGFRLVPRQGLATRASRHARSPAARGLLAQPDP